MSLMIKSGSASATRIMASEPLRAVCTSKPSARSVSDTASKRPGSSSTTSNCLAIGVLLGTAFVASFLIPQRQMQRESAAASDFTLYAYATTHLLHNVSAQIQTEADTRYVSILQKLSVGRAVTHRCGLRRRTAAVKLVEQNRHVFRWYSSSVVRHIYPDVRIRFTSG